MRGVSDRERPPRDRAPRPVDPKEPTTVSGDEAEPDWADRIRELRRARGDRLKEVFATFDEDEEDRP